MVFDQFILLEQDMADHARRRCRSHGALAACMAATGTVWECYVLTVCPQLNPWLTRAYRAVSRLHPVVAGMQCRISNHGRHRSSLGRRAMEFNLGQHPGHLSLEIQFKWQTLSSGFATIQSAQLRDLSFVCISL